MRWNRSGKFVLCCTLALQSFVVSSALAQETDQTQAPNIAGAGIKKSFLQEVGAGRGDLLTPNSSAFIIGRDPFRSIERGRQIFQRKFTRAQAIGPRTTDGIGDIENFAGIGAGLADSCAACHGRPRGSAGSGGDVFTRPDSRDAPHLFGLGLVEMLADEITQDLRAQRDAAKQSAADQGTTITIQLASKGVKYGSLAANPDGSVNTSGVQGVDTDLRVRPFFAQGSVFSMREFSVGAFNDEMGLQAFDPDLAAARAGQRVTTPSGLVLDGALDTFNPLAVSSETDDADGDGTPNEIPVSILDHLEFYFLNYFKPGLYQQNAQTKLGRGIFDRIGCTDCHIPDLTVDFDRRVADVETVYDSEKGIFNKLFATASPLLYNLEDDGSGHPPVRLASGGSFVVKNIFADFKRHDLGPNFHERNFNNTVTKLFMTEPLWGVGTTAPYGHDGRSINLLEVILRHGGEAQESRDTFEKMHPLLQNLVISFLESLVLFPPRDTASNLNPGDPSTPGFPQFGHGNIKLPVLFNDPTDLE